MKRLIQEYYEDPDHDVGDEALVIHQRQSKTDSKYLFIMVHGLGGTRYGAKSTFGNWPRYLFEDFGDADIGMYWYRTLFSRMRILHSVALSDEAEMLSHIIRDIRPYVGIVLIAHSLGGLLCKASITNLIQSKQSTTLPKVLGLFLMATPQLGSTRVGFPLNRISSDFLVLRSHSKFVADINQVFTGHICVNISHPQTDKTLIPVWAVGALPDFWVDKVSATASIPQNQIRFVRGSHTRIVKPKSKHHDAYMFVRDKIPQCLERIVMTDAQFPMPEPSREVVDLQESSPHFIGKNDALRKAEDRFDEGELAEAYRGFKEAFLQFKRDSNAEGQAMTLVGMARVDRVRGRHESSRENYSEARFRFREMHNFRGEAKVLLGVGDLDRQIGRLPEARIAYIEAKALFGRSDDHSGRAKSLRGLGEIERLESRYPEAIKSYEEALDIFEMEDDSLGKASILVNFGDLERQRDQQSKAHEYYDQAGSLYKEQNYVLGHANALVGLGDLDFKEGDSAKARAKFAQARRLYEQCSARRGEAEVLLHLGDLEAQFGSPADAEKAYTDALRIYEAADDRLGQAHAMLGRANVKDDPTKRGEVINQLNEARRLYRGANDFRGEADVLVGLGVIEKETENRELAKQHFYQAAAFYELVGVEEGAAQALDRARSSDLPVQEGP